MIILSQDKKNFINFDNINNLKLNDDYSDKELNIIANFTNGTSLILGTFTDREFGAEVFEDLMMEYRGNAIVEVPKDRR